MNAILTFLSWCCCLFALHAAETTGVEIGLISENKAIAAGKPFHLGLPIRHEKGFHTYWQNPGMAGVPVSLEWQLPAGFTAGPIQWPVPEQTLMAIHPVHGYTRDVLLLVEIFPPAEVSADHVVLEATASWMACAEACHPGSKTLSIRLPVAGETVADPARSAAFAAARAELPRPLQDWKVELLSSTDAAEIHLRFTPAQVRDSPPEDPYFFSTDGQISSGPEQKVIPGKGGAFEILAPRATYGPSGRPRLPGVLVAKSPLADGQRNFARVEPAYPDANPQQTGSPETGTPLQTCEECEDGE